MIDILQKEKINLDNIGMFENKEYTDRRMWGRIINYFYKGFSMNHFLILLSGKCTKIIYIGEEHYIPIDLFIYLSSVFSCIHLLT